MIEIKKHIIYITANDRYYKRMAKVCILLNTMRVSSGHGA